MIFNNQAKLNQRTRSRFLQPYGLSQVGRAFLTAPSLASPEAAPNGKKTKTAPCVKHPRRRPRFCTAGAEPKILAPPAPPAGPHSNVQKCPQSSHVIKKKLPPQSPSIPVPVPLPERAPTPGLVPVAEHGPCSI